MLLPGGGEPGRVATLLEEDAGAIDVGAKSAKGAYEIMANMRWEGKTLILDRTRIVVEGGVGAIGAGMRTELLGAAKQFGRQQGASEAIVNRGAQLGGRGAVTSIHVKVD